MSTNQTFFSTVSNDIPDYGREGKGGMGISKFMERKAFKKE